MQSTLVGGSSARTQGAKATLYVGGLSDGVNEAALHAAFIPFGEIKVNLTSQSSSAFVGGCSNFESILAPGVEATDVRRRFQCTDIDLEIREVPDERDSPSSTPSLPLARSLCSTSFLLLFFSHLLLLPPPAPNQSKTKQDVSIPIDNATGSHRGFGFVEFEEAADAAAAALNMDSAELFGRTLRVNQSQSRIGGGGNKREAVWADEDAWNERAEADNLDASAAFKRREVGGGGGGGGAAAAEAAAREQQRPSSSVGAAAPDPMAAAEAALG
jgi:RNA recognition motif-containing protein